MEYLITGGAGFIGTKICEELEQNNIDYFIVDDLSKGKFENIINRNKFLKIDCASKDFENWLKENNPEKIIHLCGQSSGERSHENPSNDFVRNVLSTRRILSASELNKNLKSLSYASSMSVYGNKLNAKENDPTFPLSWYGKHKLISERLIKDFSYFYPSVKLNCLRLFNVYGEGQDLKDLKQGMVSIFIAMAIKNKKIIIKGPKNRIRDFIHVKDVVKSFIKAANRNQGNKFEIFNIGRGENIEIKDIIKIISSHINTSFEYLNIRTPFDQDFCSADITKSKRLLKFIAKYELESELHNMICWAKQNF